MCIIFVAHQVHPKYPLIIASNRDEFLNRPTEPMKIWSIDDYDMGNSSNGNSDDSNQQQQSEHPHRRRVSLAGRDLVRGGTWLGIALPDDDDDIKSDSNDGDKLEDEEESTNTDTTASTSLRWIAVTNFREADQQHGRPSRGGLLMEYLDGDMPSADSFVSELLQGGRGHEYNGFNLLVGDKSGIYYYGNRNTENKPEPLGRGIFGLSNGLLDSSWPKVERGKEMLRLLCQENATPSSESCHEQLLNILCDQTQPTSDDQLPRTGLDLSGERYLSSIFLPKGTYFGKDYGTRTSTTIVVDLEGKVSVLERTWHSEGKEHSGGKDRWFRFDSTVGSVDKLDGMLVSHTR